MKVAIAGAAGFIGRAVTAELAGHHDVVPLSRRGPFPCNLFSLLEAERALEGIDVAIYLVHSMMPPSRLTQGSFADLDLIIADNFARAAKLKGVKRIVYLGGLIPDAPLSEHLESRLEVERVLASHGVPVVTLRAGLVIGRASSSFCILEKLVRRLPVMLCPRWTRNRCEPIALSDVVRLMVRVVDDPELPPGAYDVGSGDVLPYWVMLRHVARVLGLRRRFIEVPMLSAGLSRLWVSTVTQTPRNLVYPLIESLRHDMVARDARLFERYDMRPQSFDAAVREALVEVSRPVRPRLPAAVLADSAVTSVQRLPQPPGHTIAEIAAEYVRWVPRLMRPFLQVDTDAEGSLAFRLWRWKLLELTYSKERSSRTRQLYYLTGGLLLRKIKGNARGRLEFRDVPGRRELIAAVLDFRPRLPWWIYRQTQARVHLLVMRLFARHLASQSERDPKPVLDDEQGHGRAVVPVPSRHP